MKGEKLCVAVTGLHLGENAQPGPGVIRSLRDSLGSALRVVGLAYDVLDSSLYAEDLLDEAFLVPYPSSDPAAYLERLRQIDSLCGIDVLIPCLDAELPVLLHLEADMAAAGIRCVLPTRASLAARHKANLPRLARELDVSTPETLRVTDETTLTQATMELGFPCVLKGPFCEADVVHSADQAFASFFRLSQAWGLPILAQRFVSGDEYNVAALGDGSGEVLAAVAMRKTILTRMGKAWGAITVRDPDVLDVAQRVISGLRWRGGCEIELLQEGSGQIHLVEVNPRFPAWIYLTAAAGANLPLGLLRLALGKAQPAYEPYRTGTFYVRHASEAIGNTADMEHMVSRGRKAGTPAAIAP
jgi:carbamoyl-phosphate synthase large subunit